MAGLAQPLALAPNFPEVTNSPEMVAALFTTPSTPISWEQEDPFLRINDPDSPANPSVLWREMMSRWQLINDLMGGTLVMRMRGPKWLPQEPAESDAKYALRLNRTILYNGFKDAVQKLRAKPFARKVEVKGGPIPKELEKFLRNVDRRGSDLTAVASRIFEIGITYGMCPVLVDYPVLPKNATAADELHAEPMIIPLNPTDVIGWKTGRDSL